MSTNINPSNQTISECLKGKTYCVDFYQREYVWKKETVETLLKDILWTFENDYKRYGDAELSEDVLQKYNWYYLNVFITNRIDGKTYIVDGQQRLSTLTLIAVYLHHRLREEDDGPKDNLGNCVFSRNDFGKKIYNIDDSKRRRIMDIIFKNEKLEEDSEITFNNTTERTLYSRYKDIETFLDKKQFDTKKLKVFALYFLRRLILVELSIDKSDTPMVFEVINDRGEPLKPFEILKGKLIGSLAKEDTERYAAAWEAALVQLRDLENEFFVDYLKSRFIFTGDSKKISSITNEFHRYIFETDNEIANHLRFRRQDRDFCNHIKTFIEQDLPYYARLYTDIRKNRIDLLRFNHDINGLSGQYQNILAACEVNDLYEQEKIKTIARENDRMNMLLRLNGVYDSNDFQDLIYCLNRELPGKQVEAYRSVYNRLIESTLRKKLKIEHIGSQLEYHLFYSRDYTNLQSRTIRYLFARVDQYLCEQIDCAMDHDVYEIATRNGAKRGFHVEHIFSYNAENPAYFADDEEFGVLRNKLGGLLLLRGETNISSGNELYASKLKTYQNGLVWGRTLCQDTYHSTNIPFRKFNNTFREKHGIGFEPIDRFDKAALEARSKLLYEIIDEIWDFRH